MFLKLPSIVFGFHGCDEEVGHAVIAGAMPLKASENDYDWLGHGIYFWENAPHRAWQFACEQQKRGRIKKPFVVGVILDLGNCMDLLDTHYHEFLKVGHHSYKSMFPELIQKITNKGGEDKVLRYLDCAIFQFVHFNLKATQEPPFDSIRCAFEEGTPTYPGSGILDKTHIQICVRNTRCIKGYFRPLDENGTALKFD